ncbi:predicted protein [Methanosarcina acetivorans C2A]|uniref:Uncharacterized protein n=1 Tax=Methanosarcina acetivorans (strain ATCC 35395 / DSM 2834 / JCM 12185 / C2A) TaxID=188937 RepID=Q8TIP6_METAC|nr:predicted protein [Methanosarcina acetivorans C2A]
MLPGNFSLVGTYQNSFSYVLRSCPIRDAHAGVRFYRHIYKLVNIYNRLSHCIGPCIREWKILTVSVQTTPMRYIDSVTLPDTRVTERDCGKPEDELSELVRSGYSTILHKSVFIAYFEKVY